MKKRIVLLLAVCFVMALMTACNEKADGAVPKGSTTMSAEAGDMTGEAKSAQDNADAVKLTRDDAIVILKKMPQEELGLAEPITSYSLVVDDVLSDIDGNQCYGISVFADLGEKMQNMGIFYVSQDGVTIYHMNVENGTYEKIQ